MNYCDLNEYEDYIENIEFFLKEKCLQICIINSELKNRKKIYIKDIEEIYWESFNSLIFNESFGLLYFW